MSDTGKSKKTGLNIKGAFSKIGSPICQEDIITLNVQAPNNTASKYIKQKLTELKGELDNTVITVKDVDTFFSN